jgi:CpeT/CpcT family (DUF1001)
MVERAQSGGRRRLVPLTLAAVPLALYACMGSKNQQLYETELTQLLAVFPGNYDNSAQAEADVRNGVRPAHEAVALSITHVFTPRLGHYAYYAQETAADDPRRVLSQKMYGFQVDPKRGIVETTYQLIEPLRWRDGQLNKDLFTSMMTSDVQAEGCQLLWKKQDTGFVATHDTKVCPDDTGNAVPLAQFNGGVLTIGDYKFRKSR